MDDELFLNYKWGSNRPVLKSIMDFFNPSGVLELGIGKYSTPLLYKYNKKLISIETDGDWIESIKKMIEPRDNFQAIHHKLLNIHSKTKFNLISEKIKQDCIEFYKQYITPDLEFLFVDHVSGLRASSLVALFDKFQYIAYHDAEPKQFKNYNYQILTKEKTKDYIHLMNKTPLVNTGILIHRKYSDIIKSFIEILDNNNKEYCKQFGMIYDEGIKYV